VHERKELSQKILAAPELRISHILHHVDKQTNQVKMIAEAMAQFCKGARQMLSKTILATFILSLFAVFFLDIILQGLTGFPKETFLTALLNRSATIHHLPIPAIGLIVSFFIMGFLFTKGFLPWYAKKCRKNVEGLTTTDTPYREHTWSLARENVLHLLQKIRFRGIFSSHRKNLETIERFTRQELQTYFENIR